MNGFAGTESLSGYARQERPMMLVRKIVLKGAIDLKLRRTTEPKMVVVAPSMLGAQVVKTNFQGDKLVVDGGGESIQIGLGGGSVSIVSIAGQIVISGRQLERSCSGLTVVYIGLPEINTIKIKGSGDATLCDLKQERLQIVIEGSGDVKAKGAVDQLDVSIVGSGDVDVRGVIAMRSNLRVTGSGDIKAHVIEEVHASVSGSGDIVVRGNPGKRSKQVHGSGEISFK